MSLLKSWIIVVTKMENKLSIPMAIVLAGAIVAGALIIRIPPTEKVAIQTRGEVQDYELPVDIRNLKERLIEAGVIDQSKLPERELSLLNLLWAFGLANQNPILDSGEMMNPVYGGPSRFASTGGWTASVGDPMDHYSAHRFVELTPDQQALVERMARGIYRPCCNNGTHFPDCNHGMAMLGLLELMASQGFSEQEMWRIALEANKQWFPDAYHTIALYLKGRGLDWAEADPKEMLGESFSSISGFRKIASMVSSTPSQGGATGCGLETSKPKQQSSCGL